MAFNWKTFRTRTLTAIIFAAVMLAGLLWNQWSFLFLFSIIHFGCWWEYFNLLEKIYNTSIDKTIKYFFCVCGYLVFLAAGYSHYTYDFWLAVFGVEISLKWGLIIFIIICLIAFLFQNKKLPDKLKWFALLGLIYISVSLGLMVNLYKETNISIHDTKLVFGNPSIPLMIIISIWINDTMAYIVGSLIGKTPLSKISPKKTWEGTIGGIILSVGVVGLVIFYGLFNSWPVAIAIMILAGIASIAGTFGDLLESKLKRTAGVKDSGNIMPGHGGFLDRFDSMLLAIPAVWLYVFLFLN